MLQPSAHPAREAAASGFAEVAPLVIYRTAKLIYPHGEYLCVVRDVSTETVSARIYHALPPNGGLLHLELGSGERFALRLIEVTGDLARFSFADMAETDVFIDDGRSPFRKRGLRIKIVKPAVLFVGERRHQVTLHDLSQQGACIHCEGHLPVGALVRLEVGDLPAVVSKVRWRRAPLYGLIFEETFRFDELARLIGPLQAPSALSPSTPLPARTALR